MKIPRDYVGLDVLLLYVADMWVYQIIETNFMINNIVCSIWSHMKWTEYNQFDSIQAETDFSFNFCDNFRLLIIYRFLDDLRIQMTNFIYSTFHTLVFIR